MPFSLLEHYEPPKNQGPSKVYRFPLYARPRPSPPSPPPATDPPKEESKEETAPPPAPEWSYWQPINGPEWEGFWRAAKTEDGGWTYQFTKDGSVIWQQKPFVPEAATSSTPASAKTAVKSSLPPSAHKLSPPRPPTPPAKSGHHGKPAPAPAPATATATAPAAHTHTAKAAESTAVVKATKFKETTFKTATSAPAPPAPSVIVREVPSFTVIKPPSPPPPPPPPPPPKKMVVGNITLPLEKKGEHYVLPIDPEKPIVIRRVLEK